MILVGHRGAGVLEPENTVLGYQRGIEMGMDFLECDVRLTRDERQIMMHDEAVDRTTNGSGPVAEFSFEEIRALDAGKGQQVPTLEETLETVRGKVQLLLELKGPGTALPAAETVKRLGVQDQIVFTCFEFERLEEVKQFDSSLRVGAIFGRAVADMGQTAADLGAEAMGLNYRHMAMVHVEDAHKHGLMIRAWNPDTEWEIRAMSSLRVDGVSSNRPDILLRVFRGAD